ncbi:hypothetical protein ACFL5Z_18020 [Planctomycetota bacterium]
MLAVALSRVLVHPVAVVVLNQLLVRTRDAGGHAEVGQTRTRLNTGRGGCLFRRRHEREHNARIGNFHTIRTVGIDRHQHHD